MGFVTALTFSNLSVNRNGRSIIAAADLEIESGTVVGVWGTNGSGKTTMLDAVCGFAHVESGEIHVYGRRATNRSARSIARMGVGRTFQVPQIFPNLSCSENLVTHVAAARRQVGAGTKLHAGCLVQDYLAFSDLADYASKDAGVLSHGQRRLLEIGCALSRSPSILLLDEPTAGLSQSAKEKCGALLARFRETGGTAMLIEHDLELLMKWCGRVYELRDGRLISL